MYNHTISLNRNYIQCNTPQTETTPAALFTCAIHRGIQGLNTLLQQPIIKKWLIKNLLIAILMIAPLKGYGQRLQISPTSVPLWGASPQVAKISLSYRSVELVYLYGFKTMYDDYSAVFGGEYFGIFWYPLSIEQGRLKLSGEAGYFFRKYPTINGTHLNFSVKLLFKITEYLGIQYSHISNGFGVLNPINPGVDNIGLVVEL